MGSRLQGNSRGWEGRRGEGRGVERRGGEGKGVEYYASNCPNCGNCVFLRHKEGGCSSFYIKMKVNFMSHERGENTVMLTR